MDIDTRLINIILLGFGFMCVFTAFQTMGNIEETLLNQVRKEDPNFTADGYTSLAIIYSVFALSNWFAPSIISLTSAKIAMILGAIIYTLFILSFLILKTWLLYLMSAIIGFGAAIIWTGQGNYLILNSDKTTVGRNSGIFWAMLQCSMFFGNIFVYFQFQVEEIDESTRNVVFIVLGIVAAVGIAFLCTLRAPDLTKTDTVPTGEQGPIIAFVNSLKLFATREMILLVVTFFYTGIELSFFSGVYSTSIAFTKQFKQDSKALAGLSGVFVGVGEVIGGLLFSITGSKLSKWGRDPIVISGFLVHVVAFFLIFINLPNMSPIEETNDGAFIQSNAYLALFCSFMLGLGDSCFNTQIYSMLGSIWASDSAPAVAIFKFVQSVGAAASFFYGKHATLQIHLGVLLGFSLIGTATFCLVEWMHRVRERNRSELASNSDSLSTNEVEEPSKGICEGGPGSAGFLPQKRREESPGSPGQADGQGTEKMGYRE